VFKKFQIESFTEHPANLQRKPGVTMSLLTQIRDHSFSLVHDLKNGESSYNLHTVEHIIYRYIL